MKYKINYGSSVTALPGSVSEIIDRAGERELRALIYICSAGGELDERALSKLSMTENELKDAASFWRGAGVLTACDEESVSEFRASGKNNELDDKAEAKASVKKLARSSELPIYTSDELSSILEKRSDTATLIDECQNIMGRVFNVREINIIIGLIDYLGLDCEYVMMLLSYCVSTGKKTLHYVERTAFSLYDAGICTPDQLVLEFQRRERAASAEGKIRALFGIGERAFTTKEKKLISSWVADMGYGEDVIERAYEVTANATGKGSIPYANSVIERWHAAGLRTLADIEAADRQKEVGAAVTEGSFDTDEFFDAAVRRALGGE